MSMSRIRIESGTGHKLLVCSCGWREMVFSESALQASVYQHKYQVHGDAQGANNYANKRKERGFS